MKNNTPLVSHKRSRDLRGSLEGAGGIGGLLARSHGYSGGTWSSHNYYHADGNGNVTALVDSLGALQAGYRYDPYGRLLDQTGPLADANLLRWSSKPWVGFAGSAVNGLYYYGYRFYDPYLQRWPNRDPLKHAELRQGPNLYVFVKNSPVSHWDRDGRELGYTYEPPAPGQATGRMCPPRKGPCAQELENVAALFAGNFSSGSFPSLPGANDDDSLQHCITSCRLARACGSGFANLLGQMKEVRDWLMGEGIDPEDLDANRQGRDLATNTQESCEAACQRTRSQYGHPLP